MKINDIRLYQRPYKSNESDSIVSPVNLNFVLSLNAILVLTLIKLKSILYILLLVGETSQNNYCISSFSFLKHSIFAVYKYLFLFNWLYTKGKNCR